MIKIQQALMLLLVRAMVLLVRPKYFVLAIAPIYRRYAQMSNEKIKPVNYWGKLNVPEFVVSKMFWASFLQS